MAWLMVVGAVVGQALLAAALQRGSTTAAMASMDSTSVLLASVVGLALLGDQIADGRVLWVAGGLALVVLGVVVMAAVAAASRQGARRSTSAGRGEGEAMTDTRSGSALLPPTGTILLPAYNEADCVAETMRRITEVLAAELADRDWEILVVDDGSSDGTAVIAEAAAARIDSPQVAVRVLRHVANRGLGGALQTGFAASTGASSS